MPSLTTVITHATGDVYPASDWNTYNRDDINYLIAAGADLASAATIITTNEFHAVTGVTTIDNLSPAAPVAGQRIRLWIKGGPLTIRNNGGGTGNIRTATGASRVCSPNEIIEFAYDSTNSVWREQRPLRGSLIAYGTNTSGASTSGTTFGTGADILSSALSFTADGSSDYVVSVYSRVWFVTASNANAVLNLDGADQGQFANCLTTVGVQLAAATPILAPAAGAHTVNVRLVMASAGNVSVVGGAGGAGAARPILVTLGVL